MLQVRSFVSYHLCCGGGAFGDIPVFELFLLSHALVSNPSKIHWFAKVGSYGVCPLAYSLVCCENSVWGEYACVLCLPRENVVR